MKKRYKYRARPDASQREFLAQTFGCARVVFNKYVEHKRETGTYLGYGEAYTRFVKELKLHEEYAWLGSVSSIALQQTLKDAAKAAFDKTKGNLRFKKYGEEQSFRILGHDSFRVNKLNKNWGEVVLPKMKPLRFRTERPLPSNPSSVTVIKEPSGKYYVSFVVEVPTQEFRPAKQGDASGVGLDMGLTHYLTSYNSAGEASKIENPRWFRNTEEKLAVVQRVLSKKTRGSKNYEKQRIRVARIHERIRNQRLDFVRKLVSDLTNQYQHFSIETLSVTAMLKNRNLSKSIADASWGTFFRLLSEKTGEKGRSLVQQDRFLPSTKTCSHCGVIRKTLSLSIREWECGACGTLHNRDTNAAKNLFLLLGLEPLNPRKAGDSLERRNLVSPEIGTTQLHPERV